MYDFIRGKLARLGVDHVVLDHEGLGFRLQVPGYLLTQFQGELGRELTLFTHLHIADPELKLFGFKTADERELFLLFQSVSKVGPSLALALVSASQQRHVLEAISAGDPSPLLGVKGVGRKTAERICVELKDRMNPALGGALVEGSANVLEDLAAALSALGFSRIEARTEAVKAMNASPGETGVEVLIKQVLRQSGEGA